MGNHLQLPARMELCACGAQTGMNVSVQTRIRDGARTRLRSHPMARHSSREAGTGGFISGTFPPEHAALFYAQKPANFVAWRFHRTARWQPRDKTTAA